MSKILTLERKDESRSKDNDIESSSGGSNDSLHLTGNQMNVIVNTITDPSINNIENPSGKTNGVSKSSEESGQTQQQQQQFICRCAEMSISNPSVVPSGQRTRNNSERDPENNETTTDSNEEIKGKQRRTSIFSRFLPGRRESRSKAFTLDEEIEQLDTEISKTTKKLEELQLKRLELEALKDIGRF